MSRTNNNNERHNSQSGTANNIGTANSSDANPSNRINKKIEHEAEDAVHSGKQLNNDNLVEIDKKIIIQAEEALEHELPTCCLDKELLEPLADQWNNEQITNHVRDTLLESPIIASMLFIAEKLRTDCEIYDTSFERIEQRHLKRQAKMPLKIPASKALSIESIDVKEMQQECRTQSSWYVELLTFWRNWAGVGAAALAMALLMTLALEILSQVNGLKRGSWELVQTYTGAFGFTWGFTVAVVAFTRWREQIREDSNASHLNKVMSQRFIYISWIGLANMGLHLGLMHSFGSDEPFLYGIHRCLLTTFSVISLGGVGVVIEKWTLNAGKKAYEWTLVHNQEVDDMEELIRPITIKRAETKKLLKLSDAIVNRVTRHINSQKSPWCSYGESCREKNKKVKERAKAVLVLNEAKLILDSLEEG